MTIWNRINTILLLLVLLSLLAVVGMLAADARGGSLDPPDAPSSTMKSLDDIPGSWHIRLSSVLRDDCNSQRFRCVMSDQAVLDIETGLVWQRTVSDAVDNWAPQNEVCLEATTGFRRGWRPPTVAELTSLLTPSPPAPGQPALPSGHPFLGVVADLYFTANRDISNGHQWIVHTETGGVTAGINFQHRIWCVRGGIGVVADS